MRQGAPIVPLGAFSLIPFHCHCLLSGLSHPALKTVMVHPRVLETPGPASTQALPWSWFRVSSGTG